MNDGQQQYLNDLDRRLWSAADCLRGSVNPSEYMHVVLGLVFLKYVSDAFEERRAEPARAFADDEPGFCRSATLDEVAKNGYVLTPGRYVGAATREVDGEPFEAKMARLTATLREQFAEGEWLEEEIRQNFSRMGI